MYDWDSYSEKYNKILNIIDKKLLKLKEDLERQFSYSPIEKISYRVKTLESVTGKLKKKGFLFSEENLKYIDDIAGVRVICRFLDDIREIVLFIKSWNDMKIIEEKDFITSPKKTGYRSHHLICEMNNLRFEIQLRTLAMDFWAQNEHMLNYKYHGEIPENLKKELLNISEISNTLDHKMNTVRKEMNVGTISDRIVEQILNSIAIFDKIGLSGKADFYRKDIFRHKNDIDALRKIAIRAKNDVPKQYWT